MEPNKPIVRVANVTKVFQTGKTSHTALNDVSFEIQPGEVVSLIGPSGSGKSTCLRTINGLETITSGHIEVCGISYGQTKNAEFLVKQQTAMVFQRFELFPHFSALENVALGPRLVQKKSKPESLEIAADLLAQVGLQYHAHKYPDSLSGGQQQRVAIARALALNPKVLLCDEPTSALDPELVDEVVEILMAIAGRGVTMLIVTHELAFAQKISKRALFFDEGRIVEQGPSSVLFSSPQTARLQQFLKKIRHDYS